MNLFHLRYFVELAPHPTLYQSRGTSLYCPAQSQPCYQPAGSELGVPLFERSGRNTTLTCFGSSFWIVRKML